MATPKIKVATVQVNSTGKEAETKAKKAVDDGTALGGNGKSMAKKAKKRENGALGGNGAKKFKKYDLFIKK
jgi:hypothetical protein